MAQVKDRGMTLVEVLAGVAITGVMLAGVLAVRQRLVRQWVAADHTLLAVDAADELLSRWYAEGEPPFDSNGSHGDLRWRTMQLADDTGHEFELRVLRLEMFDSHARSEPLLMVDTVWSEEGGLPSPRDANGEGTPQ